jgi:hypothetical protein
MVSADGLVAEGGEGGDAHEGALEAADVGADALGKELEDAGLELDGEGLGFFAEDGEAGLDVGGLKLGGEAPFEAGDEALLEVRDFRRGRSLERTICLWPSKRVLKVWKNSSWERSLPAKNWMSSMRRRSAWR